MHGLAPWIVTLFTWLDPHSEHREDFPLIAQAIDDEAHRAPVYESGGEEGVIRTVAELVSLAHREGHLWRYAVGRDGFGESYGLYQIHQTNLPRLGMTKDDAFDPWVSTRQAIVLLKESHRICAGRPVDEQLGHYASGRGRCDIEAGLDASRNRMHLAEYLLRGRRVFWTNGPGDDLVPPAQ